VQEPPETPLARTLRAVHLFHETKFNQAIDIFLELETTPGLVLALYPEEISGPLSAHKRDWLRLFGGEGSLVPEEEEEKKEKDADSASVSSTGKTKHETKPAATSFAGRWVGGWGSSVTGAAKAPVAAASKVAAAASGMHSETSSIKETPRKGPGASGHTAASNYH
jgi:hypothetical protein